MAANGGRHEDRADYSRSVALPQNVAFAMVSPESAHVRAGERGAAYCWGGNENGQLGNGTVTEEEDNPVVVVGPSGGPALAFSWSAPVSTAAALARAVVPTAGARARRGAWQWDVCLVPHPHRCGQ